MQAYAKGVAHAALGQIEDAERAQNALAAATQSIPADLIFLSNPVCTMLGIASAMLAGELEYRKRNYDAAFDSLRIAGDREA